MPGIIMGIIVTTVSETCIIDGYEAFERTFEESEA